MRNHMKIKILASLVVVFVSLIVLNGSHVFAQQTAFPSVEIAFPDAKTIDEISWRPDGSLIAWAVESDIRVYTPDLQEIARLEGHTDRILSLDWSPDGTKIVSGSLDATIRIWDVETTTRFVKGPNFGTTIANWNGGHEVQRVVWSPNATKIASRSRDETIQLFTDVGASTSTRIWDVVSGEVLQQLPSYAGSHVLAWSPDSRQIVNAGKSWTSGYAIRVWDVDTGDLLYAFPYDEFHINDAEWSYGGAYLAITSAGLLIDVADTSSRSIFLTLNAIDTPTSLSWSPDNTKIATGDETGTLVIWDRATGQMLEKVFGAHKGYIREVEWSVDGIHLASVGSGDKTLRIWRIDDLPDVQGTATATPNYATAISLTHISPTATP